MTIIHVDDDDYILEHYGKALVDAGHTYHSVNNSRLAIDAITKISPELIILDVAMPYLNGIDLIQEIRQIQDFEETPIIFLTSMPYALCGDLAKSHGAKAYLSKKLHTPESLVNSIENLI